MKWIKFLLAGFFTFASVYQLYSTGINYREMSQSYREESRDKTISPDHMRDARIYADVYYAVSVALNSTLMFAMAIVYFYCVRWRPDSCVTPCVVASYGNDTCAAMLHDAR